MNLVEAIEQKKALEDIIQEQIDSLQSYLDDKIILSEILTEIDHYIDQFFILERLIQKGYESTMISSSESISDVISYIDSITKKIDVLKHVILQSNKSLIKNRQNTDVDINTVLSSIKQYEELKNILIKKVKDACFSTCINTQDLKFLG